MFSGLNDRRDLSRPLLLAYRTEQLFSAVERPLADLARRTPRSANRICLTDPSASATLATNYQFGQYCRTKGKAHVRLKGHLVRSLAISGVLVALLAVAVSWASIAAADRSSDPTPVTTSEPPSQTAQAVLTPDRAVASPSPSPADIPDQMGVYYVEDGKVISTAPVAVGDVVRELGRSDDGTCNRPTTMGLVMNNPPDMQYDAGLTVDEKTCDVIITEVHESAASPDPATASTTP